MRLLRSIRAFLKDAHDYSKKSLDTLNSEAIVLSNFLNPDYVRRLSETAKEQSFTFGLQ